MREILFRGKRIAKDEFVEGFVFKQFTQPTRTQMTLPVCRYKKTTLQELDVEKEKLLAYLRLAHTLGFLPIKKYEIWCEKAVEIGKMLGGWLKTVNAGPKT